MTRIRRCRTARECAAREFDEEGEFGSVAPGSGIHRGANALDQVREILRLGKVPEASVEDINEVVSEFGRWRR